MQLGSETSLMRFIYAYANITVNVWVIVEFYKTAHEMLKNVLLKFVHLSTVVIYRIYGFQNYYYYNKFFVYFA